MDDATIHRVINDLSSEEELLWQGAADGQGLSTAAEARLQAIKVELDRAYDLLHQREARRAAGLDPDEAVPRPADTVEHYQQ